MPLIVWIASRLLLPTIHSVAYEHRRTQFAGVTVIAIADTPDLNV
jgi:hypothetical protein